MRVVATTLFLLASAGAAFAQAPAPAPAAPAAATPRDPPNNDATGIIPDQWIGYADRVMPHVTHDVMIERKLFSRGDGSRTDAAAPGAPRKVLTYHDSVALWELEGRNVTSLFSTPEMIVLYVESGEGTLDDGKSVWDLKPGMAALIPAALAHRFTNTSDAPLKMMVATQKPDGSFKQRADILVRDVNKLAYTERNGHWANMAKYVFLGEDGLYETDHMYIVYMPSWTIAGAHAHTPGQEEYWIKITDGPSVMQLGSEARPWPINSGFMVPPNGRTVHAAINTSDTMQAWFYMSRLSERHPAPNPNATPRPEAAAIAQAVAQATVTGRPLAETKRGR